MKADGSDAVPLRPADIFSPAPAEEFDECRRQICRALLRLTRDHGEAEDLAQESLLTCWRKRHLYEGRGSFAGFVQRTAFRLWLNQRKRRNRRERLAALDARPDPARQPTAADELARADALAFFLDRLREALEALPEEQRAAFVMFRLEGLTCAEIASRKAESVKTIETRVRRATLALAKRLERHRSLLQGWP